MRIPDRWGPPFNIQAEGTEFHLDNWKVDGDLTLNASAEADIKSLSQQVAMLTVWAHFLAKRVDWHKMEGFLKPREPGHGRDHDNPPDPPGWPP